MALLDKARALLSTHPQSSKIFVIGTGRAGTHWLGNILDSHPDIVATIEKRRVFGPVTRMAIDPRYTPILSPVVHLLYRTEHARVAPKHYADKTHPNIWFVEDLARVFPDAKFVGIQRNPYATVSSMLRHDAVRRWSEEWEKYPRPNAFLGITNENEADYRRAPLAAKCTYRWLSHKRELENLAARRPDLVLAVRYEDLMAETDRELERLQQFLGLSSPFPPPEIQLESRDKWRSGLTESDIEAIREVTAEPLPT